MKAIEKNEIKQFLTPHKIAYFESTSEPESIAWEEFLKQRPGTSYVGFVRTYNSEFLKFKKLNRMCAISNLRKGTYFRFKKKGNLFVAHDRFIRPGKGEYEMSFHYLGNVRGINFHGHIKYKLSKAQSRLVYLEDDHKSSARISLIKVVFK